MKIFLSISFFGFDVQKNHLIEMVILSTPTCFGGEIRFFLVFFFLCCVDALLQNQHFFSHVKTIFCLPGLNPYQAEDKVSCSRTQHSASVETRTKDPLILSLTLSHCPPHFFELGSLMVRPGIK